MNKELTKAVNLIINHCKQHYKSHKDCNGCSFKKLKCESPCYYKADKVYCCNNKEREAVNLLYNRFKWDYYCYACRFFYLYNCGNAPKDWIKND